MYQNEGSTTATRVAALTFPIAAAAANLKESSVDNKSFNATYVYSSLIILRFSSRLFGLTNILKSALRSVFKFVSAIMNIS